MLPRRATLLPHAFPQRGLPLVSRCLLPVVVGLSMLVPSLVVAQSSVRSVHNPPSAGERVGCQTVTVTGTAAVASSTECVVTVSVGPGGTAAQGVDYTSVAALFIRIDFGDGSDSRAVTLDPATFSALPTYCYTTAGAYTAVARGGVPPAASRSASCCNPRPGVGRSPVNTRGPGGRIASASLSSAVPVSS